MTESEYRAAALALQQQQIYIQALMGLVTALIGITGVMVGHYVLTKSKKREELANFWQNYAIVECADPIMDYVGNLSQRLEKVTTVGLGIASGTPNPKTERFSQQVSAVLIPHASLHRFAQLTGHRKSNQIVFSAEMLFTKHEVGFDPLDALNHQIEVVALLRFVGLIHQELSCSTIKSRSDIKDFKSRSEIIKIQETFLAEMENLEKVKTKDIELTVEIPETRSTPS